MWSLKKIILGTLAVGGVVTAGYMAYRYFTNTDDTKPEETTDEVEKEILQVEPAQEEPAADQTQEAEQVEPEGHERLAQNVQPIPRPKCLEHVKTIKDLEMTLEALAAYLFTQNLSEEDLKAAQRELGWVWYAALAFKSRLPQNVPLLLKQDNTDDDDEWLPLQDELTGMQSVD